MALTIKLTPYALRAVEEAQASIERAILAVPTSEIRNTLTEVNMTLMAVLSNNRANEES